MALRNVRKRTHEEIARRAPKQRRVIEVRVVVIDRAAFTATCGADVRAVDLERALSADKNYTTPP